MSRKKDPQRGGGCLRLLLGFGVLLVGAGIALEVLGDFDFDFPEREADQSETTTRGFADLPTQVDPSIPPLPPAPAPDIAPPEPVEEDGPAHTLLWHAETSDQPAVACVLRVDTSGSPYWSISWVGISCADGRQITGRPNDGSLSGIRTAAGVSFRPTIGSFPARDNSGRLVELIIDPAAHEISVHGAGIAMRLFVRELSVPNPRITHTSFPESAVSERVVRLAVPTLVSGPIPTSIAMVRATGRTPRPGDSVCELTADPTADDSFNCRLVLRCNGEVVYGLGNTGYNECQLRDSRIISASDTGTTDENSDPRVDLDFDEGRLIVSDVTPQGEWSVTFELSPDPRCGEDVSYVGSHLAGGVTSPFQVNPFSAPPSLVMEDRVLLSATARCGAAEFTFDDPVDGSLRSGLFFGPGARAIAGHIGVEGDAVWAFVQ